MEMDDDAKVAYHCDFRVVLRKGRSNNVTLLHIASYAVIYSAKGIEPENETIFMEPRDVFEWFAVNREIID